MNSELGNKSISRLAFFLSVFLFIIYVSLSLLLPEFHPFSRYPMYDSFPNYAYSFYVADTKGKIIPFRKNFKTQADEISHMYCEVFDEHNFNRGFGIESDNQLSIVGKELLAYIIQARSKSLVSDSISLHRVHYEFREGKIMKHDKQLFKSKVE
jgi:hypothetical protein